MTLALHVLLPFIASTLLMQVTVPDYSKAIVEAAKSEAELQSEKLAAQAEPADEAEPEPVREAGHKASNKFDRGKALVIGLTVFVLAIFVGFEVIAKVPPTLHTPLMSGSNAISGITVVGAAIVAGAGFGFSSFIGMVAVALATVNVVGGFLVTHRMLAMFKRR